MACSANRNTSRMGDSAVPDVKSYKITDNVHIFNGSMVGKDAAGRARPMTVSATTAYCLGVAQAEVDNTIVGHAAGLFDVPVRQGVFKFADGGVGGALAAADVGAPCYAGDDCTVNKASGGTAAIAGIVQQVDADGVWVQIGLAGLSGSDATALAATLASIANGNGAATIGVEDALALMTGATAEACLAELAKYETISLADPGTAQAIPVTRSATVNMTIGSAGAETNTLAIPSFTGQKMILNADTVGTGTRAVTCAQAINQTGNTIMTFAAARDFIELHAIKVGGALRWTVAANDGVALSGP